MSRAERRSSIRLRLALASGALAASIAALTLACLYWWTDTLLDREVDLGIERELSELVTHYRDRGRAGLAEEVGRRSAPVGIQRGVYVFAESQYTRIQGNLAAWPEGLGGAASGRELVVRRGGGDLRVRQLRMTSLTLDDGGRLGVGRDVTEQHSLQRVLGISSAGAFALALVLAIAGGLVVSRNLLRRVEGMNRTVLHILGGRAGERVPVSGRRDEFDALATHFNHLLDENDRLVARMREVTDDIAHDLRTPLSRMRGHVESALAAAGESGAEALHGLLAETNGVLETFNALLRIAQIESRSLREQMEPVDLGALARDAVDLYQPLAEEAGLALDAELESDIEISGNRHLLAQALTNLIDNAIKYAGRRGGVKIAARRSQGRAALCVSDRGPGIPAGDRERVLERFVRLDASRPQPGTGLGLSFVRAVAELHGAELRLEDNDPGLRVTLHF